MKTKQQYQNAVDPIYKGIQYKGGWYGGYTFTIDGTMSRTYETEAAIKAAITRYLKPSA